MTANLRMFLWVLFGMLVFVNYQTWMRDYPAESPATAAHSEGPPAAALDSSAPTAAPAGSTAATGTSTPAASAAANVPAAASLAESAANAAAGQVHVHTDVLDVDVSLAGG